MKDVKRVQNRLLEMAKVIHDIFTKNNIPYMISYGTLLGAVRHQGFIPWDDDLDIYLFEDENNSYEEALSILKRELPQDMFLEYFDSEPKYFHAWAHVKDLGTEAFCSEYPQDCSYTHKGISIDLYKSIRMNESQISEYLINENLNYLERRKKYNLITENEYREKLDKFEDKNCKEKLENEKEDEKVYSSLLLIDRMYENEIFPLEKYKFEDTELYGPNDAGSILKRIYGDYMKLPPVEKRKVHFSSVIFLDEEN